MTRDTSYPPARRRELDPGRVRRWLFVLISSVALPVLTAFSAGGWQLHGQIVGGAAGRLSGGAYELSGGIGVPGAGRLAGGDYVLNGGAVSASEPTPAAEPSPWATATLVIPDAAETPAPTPQPTTASGLAGQAVYLPLIQR